MRWLLVSVSTAAAPASLRVQVWRKLRSLGAVYIQSSVCLLPHNDRVRADVEKLLTRVELEGGASHCLTIILPDSGQERELISAFRAAADIEYRELLDRIPTFLAELDEERAKGRFTYAEVEESEADLARFRRWLAKIDRRDYFGGTVRDDARAAVDRCSAELEDFTLAALTAQSGSPQATAHRHLSLVRRSG